MINQGGTYRVQVSTGAGCINTDDLLVTQTNLVTINSLTSTGSANTCSSDEVTLTINTTGSSPNYQWQRQIGSDFNNISGATNNSYSTNTAGFYRVLINAGATCQQVSDPIEVAFAPLPTAGINVAPTMACPENPINLTGTIIENGATIQTILWESTPNNVMIQNANTLTPELIFLENNTNSAIDYTIKLTITTDLGCNDTEEVTISLQPLPQASFTLKDSICGNTILRADNTSTLSDTYNWQVFDGMGNPLAGILDNASAENSMLTFPENNSSNIIFYDVVLEAKRGSCSNFDTTRVSVFPQPTMVISGDTADSCTPKMLNLNSLMSNSNDGQPLNVEWFVDGLPQGTSEMFSYSLENTGTSDRVYRITLVGTTSQDCINSVVRMITVYPNPVAEFTASQTQACAPFIIDNSLITLSHYPDANANYLWEVDSAGVVVAFSNTMIPPTYTLLNPLDSVTLRLTAFSGRGCGNSIFNLEFSALADPVPAFTETDLFICHNESITFTNASTITGGASLPSGATIEWNFGDRTTSNEPKPSHIFTNSSNLVDMTYTVTLSVSYQGCTKAVSKIVTVYPLPGTSIDAGAPATVCPEEQIMLTGQIANSNIDMMFWESTPNLTIENGNTLTPTLIFPPNNTNLPIDYTISFIAKTDSGCYDTSEVMISLAPLPQASFTLPDTTICGGETVIASNTSTLSDSYAWRILDIMGNSVSDILNNPNIENPTLSFPENTTSNVIFYDVILEAIRGSCSNFDTARVSVFPQPTMVISGDTADSCTPKMLNLNSLMSNSNDGQPLNVEWFVDGLPQGTSEMFSYSLENTGTSDRVYRITLVGTTSQDCINSVVRMITVYPNPVAEFTASQTQACAPFIIDNSLITLSHYPDANANYLWEVDSAGVVVAFSNTMIPPTYTLLNPLDAVTLRLTAFSGRGCGDSIFNLVFSALADPVPAFTETDLFICHNESITFTNASTITGGASLPSGATIKWDFGDGTTASSNSVSHVFSNTSNTQDSMYTVTLSISYQGCVDSISKDVTVHPLPFVDFEIPTACGGDDIQIVNNSFGKGNLRYKWSANPSTGITFDNNTLENPKISVMTNSNADITFNISLTVESEDTCTASLTNPLLVFGDPTAMIQGDSILCKGRETRFESLVPPVSSDLAPDSLYIWNYGDGTQNTINAPQRLANHTYLDTGIYDITLTIINRAGCMDIDSFRVCVIDIPEADFTKTLISFEEDSLTVRDSVQGKSNDEICGPIVGLNVSDLSFTYDKAGVNTAYFWDFGNGQTSTLKNPPTIYYQQDDHAAVTYMVTLTLDDGFCGLDAIQDTITIFPSPKARLNFELQQACDEIPVSIFNNSVGLPTQYIYDFGDGSPVFITDDSRTIEHIFPGIAGKDTTYIVTLIAQNTCGSDTIRESIRVIPNDMRANISIESPDGFFCENENITFIANGFLDSTAQLTWHFGDGTVFTQEDTIVYSYPQAGTYQVVLEVFIPVCNDTALDTIEIVIQDSPDIDFFLSDTVCVGGNPIIENVSVIQSVSTEWIINGINYLGLVPPDTLMQEAMLQSDDSSVQVTMMLIGANGCLTTLSKKMVIKPLPKINFKPSQEKACPFDTVEFINLSTLSNRFRWVVKFENHLLLDTTSTQRNLNYVFNQRGLYTITLYAFSSGHICADSLSKEFIIIPFPKVNLEKEIVNVGTCYRSTVQVSIADSINNLNPFNTIYVLAIINGLITSIILETIILMRQNFSFIAAIKIALGMSLISMLSMEIMMNLTDYLLTGGAILTWWVIPIMLIVGFLTPWPYNYWRLKKFGLNCH